MATITPFVKRMRTQGGTIYTFSSALEDIGLNINERNNIVKMSHYALLNLPSIDAPPNLQANRFNTLAIPGAYEAWLASGSIKDGRVLIAESFQNYALNLEVNLLAQNGYNPSLQTTVSERVFWKWLKETGAIRWQKYDTSAGVYWKEELDTDSSAGYNSIVKCIGQISAGSVRTDTFGTYNETYVLVPTSFGQTPVYFKQVEDDNYYHGLSITNGNANILGRESYLSPHPDALDILAYYDLADSSTTINGAQTMYYDNSTGVYSPGWWWTYESSTYGSFSITNDNDYYIDSSEYIAEGIYNINLKYEPVGIEFKRSKVDCMSIEYDLTKLRTIFGDSTLSFDSLATDSTYVEDDQFDFNTVLIYYSVYNKSLDKVLATNLLGVLFLDPPSGNTSGYPLSEIVLPSITKFQSGPSGFGTSYSFRLNIKSDYILDDTAAIIVDAGTSSQIVLEDFSQVFDSLGKTLAILNQQTGTISYITEQYLDITTNQTNIENQIADLQFIVNDIATDIQGTPDTIAMFAQGNDPLVDSSIYMKNGKVGIFTNNPSYPVQIDASVKTKDIILENAIRDISGNILLGYGSPLQIGSSTNSREVRIYTGKLTPGLKVDTSNNVYVDSSLIVTNLTVNGKSIDPVDIITETSLGGSFIWVGGYLDVSVVGSGGGSGTGDVNWGSGNVGTNYHMIKSLGNGSIAATSLHYDENVLTIPTNVSVNGDINVEGDITSNAGAVFNTNLEVFGDILAHDNLIIQGNGEIDGSILLNGSLQIENGSKIKLFPAYDIDDLSTNLTGDVSVHNVSCDNVIYSGGNIIFFANNSPQSMETNLFNIKKGILNIKQYLGDEVPSNTNNTITLGIYNAADSLITSISSSIKVTTMLDVSKNITADVSAKIKYVISGGSISNPPFLGPAVWRLSDPSIINYYSIITGNPSIYGSIDHTDVCTGFKILSQGSNADPSAGDITFWVSNSDSSLAEIMRISSKKISAKTDVCFIDDISVGKQAYVSEKLAIAGPYEGGAKLTVYGKSYMSEDLFIDGSIQSGGNILVKTGKNVELQPTYNLANVSTFINDASFANTGGFNQFETIPAGYLMTLFAPGTAYAESSVFAFRKGTINYRGNFDWTGGTWAVSLRTPGGSLFSNFGTGLVADLSINQTVNLLVDSSLKLRWALSSVSSGASAIIGLPDITNTYQIGDASSYGTIDHKDTSTGLKILSLGTVANPSAGDITFWATGSANPPREVARISENKVNLDASLSIRGLTGLTINVSVGSATWHFTSGILTSIT